MKKVVALVLALVLALTAVVALAAPSPQGPGGKVDPAPAPAPAPATGGTTGGNGGTATVTTEKEDEAAEVGLSSTSDTDATSAVKKALKDAADAGDVLAAFGDEVELEEIYTEVNEMVTVKFPENAKTLTFKVGFQTLYKADEIVKVVIAIPGENGEVEYITAVGKADGKGSIVFTLSEDNYNKVAGKTVVLIPVSEKK